jgi:hypothetical protein
MISDGKRARRVLTALFLSLWCFTSTVSAETVLNLSGLVNACTRAEMSWVDFCNGYFQAAVDLAARQGLACVPEGTTRTEVVTISMDVLSKLSDGSPKSEEVGGLEAAVFVLRELYPCG